MILPRIVHGMNLARSGIYFLEALPFTMISRLLAHPDLPPPTNEQIRLLWKHIVQLHEREAQNIERGVYPASAVEIENPLRHVRSYLGVLGDGLKVAWRMRNKENKSFSAAAESLGQELPEYYTRNFHNQTDGYLSEASAQRYDHQVEILFSGTAGAMRRLILPVLKQATKGEGHWLELGCGAGSATKPVLATFPTAKITALDMSAPYLKVAQRYLHDYPRVDFLQGDATQLDFKSGTFNAVYSVFMLHELPKAERAAMIREAFRVLKPGGVLVLADSLQWDDNPELNWAIDRFPKSYHEPFYKEYAHEDLRQQLLKLTAVEPRMQHAFFTKVVWLQKPSNSALS